MKNKDSSLEIEKLKEQDIDEVVDLHKENLNEGLLPSLGKPAMKMFYQASLNDPTCFGFVARNASKIVGATLCSTDYLELTKKFYSKNLFKLLFFSFSYLLTHLNKIPDLLNISKSEGPHKECLIFIFTDKNSRGLGIGSKLMRIASEEFKKRGSKEFLLEVNSENKANQFYKKLNGQFVKTYKFLGVERNVYRFQA